MRGWELATGAAAGLLAGFLLWGSGGWGGASDPPADRPERVEAAEAGTPGSVLESAAAQESWEVEALRARLALEAAVRESFERQLAELAPIESGARGVDEEAPAEDSAPTADGWIDEKVLLRAGFPDSVLEELREQFEAIELERLYTRDKATREGWVGKPRFRRRMRDLNAKYTELRGEYGDDAYDWILYSAGRHNRIVVSRVMAGSAAEHAGLEVGDVFLRYDDERIFGGTELQGATAAGEPGETTAVEVMRGDESLRFFVPRGPLGVGLEPSRTQPDPL
jgi:hypothetical protein